MTDTRYATPSPRSGPIERERYLRCLAFRPVDRVPLMDVGVWDETLDRWHHEGLPKWVTHMRHLADYLHLDRSFEVLSRND